MITIVGPKEYIAKLWGKQKIKEDESYRLMKYILLKEHDGKVLLHNVVTGQLVFLESCEVSLLTSLPNNYNSLMNQLITDHFLVPIKFNEHNQVMKLRMILQHLDDTQNEKGVITYYTILPTTACNARCYYCFEKGIKPSTMSEDTASAVVNYISDHCGMNPVTIRWFGGEPTLATNVIDQICEGLKKNNIEYSSLLSTNGFLINDDIVHKAKSLWNLKQVTISVDGTEENYNNIKAFPNISESPYQRMMRNVGLLLNKEIVVALRMNFNLNTYKDFYELLKDTKKYFPDNPFLQVYAHQINGQVSDAEQYVYEKKIEEILKELNRASRLNGTLSIKRELPSLGYRFCEAASDSAVTITPEGNLVSCGEQLESDQTIGSVWKGVVDFELAASWKKFSEYEKCWDCILMPDCPKITRCNGKDHCYTKAERLDNYYELMRTCFINSAANCDN